MTQNDKDLFLRKYAHCADEWALETIWSAYAHDFDTLNLRGQRINSLEPLRLLTNLVELDVSNTMVSRLSPLNNFLKLKVLNLISTNVETLEPIKHLENLRILNISKTRINDLEPLRNLKKIEQIHAFECPIFDLEPLSQHFQLEVLDIARTFVSDLAPLKNIVEKNSLPFKWQLELFKRINGIYIKETPLYNPPVEIAKQGTRAILRYWQEQERAGTITLNEARLLIVGQGGAGKTTLRQKLMDAQAPLPAPDATTRGIEIDFLSFKTRDGGDFTLHIWDFGGQNIQHYAHQFFLSDSVVYALVHSEREQNDHSSYWLSIMALLGKTSPILLVQNEKFGHSEDLKNLSAIRERFTHVRNYHKVDLSQATATPFKALQAEIEHLAMHLPHVGKTYLRSFNDVRTLLKGLSDTQHHIPWEQFEDLCAQQGIKDPELMRDYARYFHQLGIALWFENDEFLENYVFLRPKWIIDALFELLYEGKELRKQPLIGVNDTKKIWRGDQYKGMHGNLLRLMRNFEMCYEVAGDTPQYIIPQLLPADRAEYKPSADATKVVFQYAFLPKGFLTRLTCRLHTRIADKNVWNDAVLFEDKLGATVFAKEAYAQNALELYAEGTGKRQLLNEVINTLNDIHTGTKFENLEVQTLIDCPCPQCQKAEKGKAHPFNFDYLRKKLRKGDPSVECQNSLNDVLIKDILREVNAFSFKEIRDKIANGYLKEPLNLLKGCYPDNKEVVGLQAQVSHLGLDDIHGVVSRGDKNLALNQITQRILALVNLLEGEEKD